MTERSWKSLAGAAAIGAAMVAVHPSSVRAQAHGEVPGMAPLAHWFAFSPPDGAFTVPMPDDPTVETVTSTDNGATHVQRTYTATGSGMAVVATVSDYQPDAGGRPTAEGVRDGMVKGLKASLVSSQAIGFARGPGDDVPGLEFVLRTDSLTCTADVYVDLYRVDGVLACAPIGDEAEPMEKLVLDSFVLKEGGTPRPPTMAR